MSGHVDRMLERHFAGELDHSERQLMRAHLRDCERCQAEHDALASLLRAAADAEPTAAELSRWQEDLEHRLGWSAPPETAPAPARRPILRWLAPTLSAAVALVLVCGALLTLPPPTVGPGGVTLKGGAGPALVHLELTAVATGPAGASPSLLRLTDGQEVPLNRYLQFRYRNHAPSLKHLYLLGLGPDMRPLDYYPRPSSDRSIGIQEALSPRSVGRSIALARRHEPGALWVIALFSPQPLSREAVHAALARLTTGGATPAALSAEAFGDGVVPVVRRLELVEAPR